MLPLWMELPSGLVVAQEVIGAAEQAGALGRLLEAAFSKPLAGPPRRPDRIRVATAALASEVRRVVGDSIPVVVAPTPELDSVMDLMATTLARAHDEDASYFEDGRVEPDQVAALFANARMLWTAAPWKGDNDGLPFRVDIPSLGVSGACAVVIGHLGQTLGMILFPSLAAYEAFERAADRGDVGLLERDFGSGWISLSFCRGADLPERMWREVVQHAWRVESSDAYPVVEAFESDGSPRPILARDVRVATLLGGTFGTFFATQRSCWEGHQVQPTSVSFFDDDDTEIRFTFPYEAHEFFEPTPAETARVATAARAGRNDPCPCGSGRKYKKCCLARDEAQRGPSAARAQVHQRDGEFVQMLADWGLERFGSEAYRFFDDFDDVETEPALAWPWSVYGHRIDGQPIVAWYLASEGARLPAADRAWLEAQSEAWLSVWEVREVEPGVALVLEDLLTGETRRVLEVAGSNVLEVRYALLGRIVEHGGHAYLCGNHSRPLPPRAAAVVVERARARLRRKRAVPLDRMRDDATGRALIRYWQEALDELRAVADAPRTLVNHDGDPILLTHDRFDVAPGARAEVEAALTRAGGERREEGAGSAIWRFLAPTDRTERDGSRVEVGRARLEGSRLILDTNSRRRADALRVRVESACGHAAIRHRTRDHTDPLSPSAREHAAKTPPAPMPPEIQQIVREHKQRHYAAWIDDPLPALDGQSPREAIRTAAGRRAVDVLLKEIEVLESDMEPGARFDVAELRGMLGLV